MKELSKDFQDNELQIHSEYEQKKQLNFLKQERKIRGLTLFEYNDETKELKKAKYKPVSIFISASLNTVDRTETYELIVNKNCRYVQALNAKNAKRKLDITD